MARSTRRLRYHLLPGGRRRAEEADGGLRIGYGAECELALEGGEGPPVLFEVHRHPGPLQIATRVPPADMANYVELTVDGKPLDTDAHDLRPGSRLDVTEKMTGQRYSLVVDPPPPWVVRPRFLAVALALLALLGAAWGVHLYQQLADTYGTLSRAESRIRETQAGLDEARSRIAFAEDRLAGAVRALERERAASEQAMRADLEMRLDALARRARETLAEISEEDTQARDAMRREMAEGLAGLREDFAARMVESYQRYKASEQALLATIGQRIEALEPETERFKRVLAGSRDAVLYIHTRYTVRVVGSGDEQVYNSFGTGFLVAEDGLALTAQHVLFPWRYDRELILLTMIGAVEVIEDTVRWAIWPTDAQVLEAPGAAPGDGGAGLRDEDAFRSDAQARTVRFLHAPEPVLSEELVPAPIGIVRLEIPQPGASDIAVFRLDGHAGTFDYLEVAAPATPIEPLDELLVVGYPFSRLEDGRAAPQGARGFVRRASDDAIEVDVPLHPGVSGAPLLNVDGVVVGMASAVLRSAVYGVAAHYDSLATAIDAATDAAR